MQLMLKLQFTGIYALELFVYIFLKLTFQVFSWWNTLVLEMIVFWLLSLLMELADNEINDVKQVISDHILECRYKLKRSLYCYMFTIK